MNDLNFLPIWRDANRLLLELEQAVRRFPRYHKYILGSELRTTGMRIFQTIHRAHSRNQRKEGYLLGGLKGRVWRRLWLTPANFRNLTAIGFSPT